MMCQVCRPGEMLCQACMNEEEEPKTVRIPPRSIQVLPVLYPRPYKPAATKLPRVQKTPRYIPIYEVIEPYNHPIIIG